ncbi:tectonin beta-propeller repeat-containing protein 1 isoform X1 [Syngnathus typhle]|uniref:tectonin beta-propeller repeat-containing protein 1 isoform X1 n=1 Tax=Syngnathus typhle TaxID=161592 RepID=UPI002A69E3F5|nr:tectonin beta-propeller repeat-containing protein 1 isoform X1 [Syngnathus typhle]
MSITLLWAVDVYGRVYSVSTAGRRWVRSDDALLELKRVSAGKDRCWGIGCDHHVYLNMIPHETPIRYKEETYENQRWNPVDGFTDTLLPTDRWPWSDVTGMNPQPFDSFRLPSRSWEWEGDWYVDHSCGGEPTQSGGWEYAVDFPANFSPDKKWNSCVRRRRWIRYRRYTAQGTWAKIPSAHPGKPPLPLCDISCGGWEMSDESGRYPQLWAVSQQGQVWFRDGIHPRVPEGTDWEEVEVPKEVSQLSLGPRDLLWTALWDGNLLVRAGLSLDSPTGTSWLEVESPQKEVETLHVSVGVSVVWVITKDYKVWFRRGVNSHNPCGSGWIGIVGEMMMLDVGLNDQVWAVGEDRGLYFRIGVTPSEPSGNGWIPVSAEWGSARDTVALRDGCELSRQPAEAFQGSALNCTNSNSELGPAQPVNSTSNTPVLEASDPSVVPLGGAPVASQEINDAPATPQTLIPASDSFINSLVSDRDKSSSNQQSSVPLEEEGQFSPAQIVLSPDAFGPGAPWSNVDLEGAEAARSTLAEGPRLSDGLGLDGAQGVGEEEGPVWAWISGGGCNVDAASQVSWLSATGPLVSSWSLTPVQSSAWSNQEPREEISKKPLERSNSVWVRKGTLRWWRDWKPQRWLDVAAALEQSTKSDGGKDSIFFIYYTQYDEKKYIHIFINEITALVPVARDCHYAFAVYTGYRTRQRSPLVLAAQTEKDMNDWLSLLSDVCCECRGIATPPSRQALWSTTSKGDIFAHEPSFSLEAATHTQSCDLMFWRQVPGHMRCVEANSLGVVWGIGWDGTAWVYSGHPGRQADLEDAGGVHQQSDIRSMHVYENQRWNPMTGYTDRGLPTDRPMWSDESGLRECTKGNTQPPSPQWAWVSEWAVDHNVPGGTDKEGWQYAADFPVTFHGHKTLKDFVRRRRWTRKCQITLSGPWRPVPPIPLSDVSLMPCLAHSSMEQVPLWALSDKGDVLCRLGITPQNPAGSSWLHVGTDQPFKSIAIGGANQVWAIAKDGAVFYRGSVSPQNPAGECWYHIPSPSRQTLRQLSVGRTSVFAVDENGNLWYRQGLTPSYPQGSAWELISNNVTKVSVGPLDQVWMIADAMAGFPAEAPGAVCHRLGVGPMQPKGQRWDYGIGGGWEHISVRANSVEAPRTQQAPAAGPPSPRSLLPSRVNGAAASV